MSLLVFSYVLLVRVVDLWRCRCPAAFHVGTHRLQRLGLEFESALSPRLCCSARVSCSTPSPSPSTRIPSRCHLPRSTNVSYTTSMFFCSYFPCDTFFFMMNGIHPCLTGHLPGTARERAGAAAGLRVPHAVRPLRPQVQTAAAHGSGSKQPHIVYIQHTDCRE